MTTYFEQLKEKHAYPAKAYKEYMLSKFLLVDSYCSESASDFVKEAFKIQSKFNDLARAIIESDNWVDINKILGLGDSPTAKRDFVHEKIEYINFLGLRNDISSTMTTYQFDLNSVAKNVSWSDLESIMMAEMNNAPKISSEEVIDRLKSTCDTYALESLTIGRVGAQPDILSDINTSCDQLAMAVGCDKRQIGAGVYNYFYDCEVDDCGGYSAQAGGRQKIHIHSIASSSVFAHEWMHSADSLVATVAGLEGCHASTTKSDAVPSFNILMSNIKNTASGSEVIKEYLTGKTEYFLNMMVDSQSESNIWTNPDMVKSIIKKEIEKVKIGSWDIQSCKKELSRFKADNAQSSSIAYIISELGLLNKLTHNSEIDTNIFIEHAKMMDLSLKSVGWLESDVDYSTTDVELIARSFETLVDIKLKNKNIDNKISKVSDSYVPSHEMLGKYMAEWDVALGTIRTALAKVYPIDDLGTQDVQGSDVKRSAIDRLKNIRDNTDKISSTTNTFTV